MDSNGFVCKESKANKSQTVDVLDIPETDKYIGNAVYRMLSK